MKKIAFLTHTSISPSETFIFDLIDRLSLDGELEIHLISGRLQSEAKFRGKVNMILSGFYTRYEKRSYFMYKLAKVMGKEATKQKISFQKRAASAVLSGAVNIKQYDLVYVDYFTSAVWVREFLEGAGVPYIVHAHGYDVTSATSEAGYREELGQVFKGCSAVITASHHVRKLVTMLGCDPSKINVIRYGLDAAMIKPMGWEERKKLSPSLVFLGRLTQKKHPVALLYSVAEIKKQFPGIVLHIIGDGPLKQEVQQSIISLGLDKNVVMHGSLPREKSFPILNAAWIYMQHSVTAISGDQEGFAISLAEAAAHGLPVVSTLHNGITEQVKEGETGYLVQEHDYEAMAEKVVMLLKDTSLAEKLGEAGRKHILVMCDQTDRVASIKELLLRFSKR